MRKSTRSLLALTAVISISAAACGSDDEETPVDTTVDAPSVTTAAGDDTVTTDAMEDPATTDAMEDPASTDHSATTVAEG